MPSYVIRFDDITPGMDFNKFEKCLAICEQYGVKPLIGIVPDNADPFLEPQEQDPFFWKKMRELFSSQKTSIAQHGYRHIYHKSGKSILAKYGIGNFSEFAGLPVYEQLLKIKKGKEILEQNGIFTDIWMAPNHSFDKNTIIALEKSGFQYVTDGIGLYPYKKGELLFVPQMTNKPRRIPFGVSTVCIHTNTITNAEINDLEEFLRQETCISFEEAVVYPVPVFASFINLFVKISFFFLKSAISLYRFLRNK